MKKLVALILVLASCSPGASDRTTVPAGPSPIAFLGADGNLALFDPATGATSRLTSNAGPHQRYTQPTWSPDGTRLAYVGSSVPGARSDVEAAPVVRTASDAQGTFEAAIHITTVADGATVVIEIPFVAFYLYWSPDGMKLAFLGNDPAVGGQALGLVDLPDRTVRIIDTGRPYYFAWAPASDRLLVHARNAELYYLRLDGSKSALDREPGSFSAPHWVGTTQLYPIRGGDGQELTVFDEDGTRRRRAASPPGGVALALSPDEERVAFIEIAEDASPFALGPLRVDGEAGVVPVADEAAAFFWSPAGDRLLYLTGDVSEESFSFRWHIWDGETTTAFEPHTPSLSFLRDYFPFFGQYASSLTFFSPDGASFTFAGAIDERGEGIWLQDIEGGSPATMIAEGEFATWAP